MKLPRRRTGRIVAVQFAVLTLSPAKFAITGLVILLSPWRWLSSNSMFREEEQLAAWIGPPSSSLPGCCCGRVLLPNVLASRGGEGTVAEKIHMRSHGIRCRQRE
jgi:hypothetical protein